jgi:pimeloyl-ACP methyl ester carboxylesterase
MKLKLLLLIFLFITHIVSSQENDFKESEINIPTKTQIIYGTLLTPNAVKKPPLVILIPGSGPTDRDGNNAVMKNNSLKYLAESLSNLKIATYRFDKSVLTFTKKDSLKIKALTFNTFINEATSVIEYFKKSKKYSKIIIAGHSQGSLVGMVASQNNVDAFISLEGAGRLIDEIIIEQIAKQAPYLKEETIRVLKELKQGKLVTDFNPMLISLFNQQVQPFLISWIQYNPQIEIKKLTIPILIIQGTKDIQVSIKDAELLHNANTASKLQLIENMNHIFKEINADVNENLQSYSNPKLPITPILTTSILNFINQLK